MSVELIKNPYCLLDLEDIDHPIEVDERYISVLGYTREDYKNGKIDFSTLINDEDKRELAKVLSGENGFYYLRHNMNKKDGTTITVDAMIMLYDKDGRKRAYVSFNDYTHQKELALKSDSYRKEIEALTSDIVGGVAVLYADDLRIYRCNNEFRKFFDVEENAEVPPIETYIDDSEKARLSSTVEDAIKHNIPAEIEVRFTINGRDRWFLIVGRPFDSIGGRDLIYAIFYDMTHEKKMICDLELQAARYRFITQTLDHIFIDYDVRSDTLSLSSSINRYGDPEVEDYLKKHKSYDNIHPDDLNIFKTNCGKFLDRPYSSDFEIRTKTFDEEYTWYKLSLTSVAGSDMKVTKVYGVMSNIQDVKKLSKRLEMDNEYINFLITTDSVTGMLNYKTFVSKADELLKNRDKSYVYGFVYSDINGFSYVNDNLGFEAGNKMLRSFGQIITNVQTNIIACRIYSDFFIGLYRARTVNELVSSLNQRNHEFYIQQQKLLPGSNLNICAGLYIWDDGVDIERAVFNANLARKSVKGISHGDCGLYDPQMHIQRAREQKIANELNMAIDSGLIEMFLQPKFSMETMEVIGAEALARWRNVDGTYIMPGEFIAVLEKVGYIDELDFYIYSQVLDTLVDWKSRGKKLLPISVNFSRQHVRQADYVDKIISLAKQRGVSPEYVEIEITESCFGDDLDKLFRDMSKLQEAGFRIDIDDFGVSYSTLGVLLNAPVDMVKIDKSFIDDITSNEKERVYVKNICQLISTMDKDLIFEGVETKEQAQILCEIGYTKAQGWLFDKALPLSVFNEKYMK
ncbi:MAG: EAL domain-containing protein [Ruminococcus sp.]|nr:EAL domain-containing protein [Ruminococcus sp.]